MTTTDTKRDTALLDELENIVENGPLDASSLLSLDVVTACIKRGWVHKYQDGRFEATDKGRTRATQISQYRAGIAKREEAAEAER